MEVPEYPISSFPAASCREILTELINRVRRRRHRPPRLVVSSEKEALVSVATAFYTPVTPVGLIDMTSTSIASILAPISISALRARLYLRRLTDKTGHALRGKAGGAFGPDLAKKLSQLVKMEKNVMRSMELVAKERMEVAVSIFFLYHCFIPFIENPINLRLFLATIVPLG
jgi:hypothetical protein